MSELDLNAIEARARAVVSANKWLMKVTGEDVPALVGHVRELESEMAESIGAIQILRHQRDEAEHTVVRMRGELSRHEQYLPAAFDSDCCGRCNALTGDYVLWPCPTFTVLSAVLDSQDPR